MHLLIKKIPYLLILLFILILEIFAQTTYECSEDDRVSGSLRAVGRVQIYFPNSSENENNNSEANDIDNAELATAFILSNGKLVTAGHVANLFNSESYVQFGTLRSDAYGHPLEGNPNDKYKIISLLDPSKYSPGENNADMNDWAVFEVQPNANTGKMPKDVYGYIEVERVTPSANMEIYFEGYGSDSEQTKSFSKQRSNGKVLSYIPDDYAINFDNYNIGGHSGRPIINMATEPINNFV